MKTKAKMVIGNGGILTVIFALMIIITFSGKNNFVGIELGTGFIGLLVIALLIICWQIYLLLEKSVLGWSFNIILGSYTLVVGVALFFYCLIFHWLCAISVTFPPRNNGEGLGLSCDVTKQTSENDLPCLGKSFFLCFHK